MNRVLQWWFRIMGRRIDDRRSVIHDRVQREAEARERRIQRVLEMESEILVGERQKRRDR